MNKSMGLFHEILETVPSHNQITANLDNKYINLIQLEDFCEVPES